MTSIESENSLYYVIFFLCLTGSICVVCFLSCITASVLSDAWKFCTKDSLKQIVKIPTMVVIIIGIYFIVTTLLFVYFDVLRKEFNINIRMDIYYLVFFSAHIIFLLSLIPCCLCMEARYESLDFLPKTMACQWCCGSCGTIIINIVFWFFVLLVYFLYHDSRVPFKDYTQVNYGSSLAEVKSNSNNYFINGYEYQLLSLKLQPHILVFIIGVITMVSWILLICLGGTGICGCPIAICCGVPFLWGKGLNRLNKNDFVEHRSYIRYQTEKLLIKSIEMKKKGEDKKSLMLDVWNLKRKVEDIERESVETEDRFLGGNSMLFGVINSICAPIFGCIGLLWLIHILLSTFLKEGLDLSLNLLSVLFALMDYYTVEYIKSPILGYLGYFIMILYLYISVTYGLYLCCKCVDGKCFMPRLSPIKFQKTNAYHLLIYVSTLSLGLYAILDMAQNTFEPYATHTYLNVLFRNTMHFMMFWEWIYGILPTIYVFFTFMCCCCQCVYYSFFYRLRFEKFKKFKRFKEDMEDMKVKNE